MKKDIKPDQLYEPNLSRPKPKKLTDKERARKAREEREEMERLTALAPAPIVKADPDFTP